RAKMPTRERQSRTDDQRAPAAPLALLVAGLVPAAETYVYRLLKPTQPLKSCRSDAPETHWWPVAAARGISRAFCPFPRRRVGLGGRPLVFGLGPSEGGVLHGFLLLVVVVGTVPDHEAGPIELARQLLVGRAGMDGHQLLLGAIIGIGSDQVAAGAVLRSAVAVDLPGLAGVGGNDGVAQLV